MKGFLLWLSDYSMVMIPKPMALPAAAKITPNLELNPVDGFCSLFITTAKVLLFCDICKFFIILKNYKDYKF